MPHFPPVTRDSVVYAITNPGGLPQLPSCLGPLMPGEMYQMYVDDNGIWRAAIKRGPVHAEASDASAAPPVDQPAAADDDNGGAGEESINELLARLNLHDVRDVVHRFERQPAASAEGTPYRMIADDTTTAALWDHARTHRASLAPDLRRRVENRDAESTAMRLEVYRVALAAVAQVHVGATAWACTELNAQGLMQQLAPMRRSNTR